MKLNNNIIYQYAQILNQAFDNLDIYIPAKANFFIQKNRAVIAAAAQEVDKSRIDIIRHYGEPDESGEQIVIPQDKIEVASKELEDLFTIEQELDIKTFSIESLGDTQFTAAQMQAIMFMIED